ncbi:hypothetical protein Slin15195_G019370 [Septoria linicola]|uniref:Uncharacterized protein n=1 Tax=Septoria linicola TaxID=215465 RepID=A0A9Q9EGU2_9PEZI|nr:hypothetical protein Slin14017_G019430 [Septoria linicola]USW48618.1 hypothetical protein Slin15195_G019370 [Septoria linicola]
MNTTDGVGDLLKPLLDASLASIIEEVCFSTLSRVSASRLRASAIPHIGQIELVDSTAFQHEYSRLYTANFSGHEREHPSHICERLEDQFAGRREGFAPYYIIGIRDADGTAIAAAQFSVLLPDSTRDVIPYLQYIYVRPQNRAQLLSEVLHTLVLAVAVAVTFARRDDSQLPHVPFTICETQPEALERSKIHSKSGSQALMLKRRADGRILSAHIQPGLEPEDPPTTLVWLLRRCPGSESSSCSDELGRALVAAYFDSLREEGIPGKNVDEAESILEARYEQDCMFCQIPLSDVSRDMYVGIDP